MSALSDLSAELAADFAKTAGLARGLHAMLGAGFSDETLGIIRALVDAVERRRGLVQSARTALEVLAADGYPRLDTRVVNEAVAKEVTSRTDDVRLALSYFQPPPVGELTFGEPVLK